MSSRTSKKTRAIDRLVPGLGRLTIRTKRMTGEARNELDRHITRAVQAGYLEQLRLLKERVVTPQEFLEAARTNRLLALRPAALLRPLVDEWLSMQDLRDSSDRRYRQSWSFIFASLPADATVASLSERWWAAFVKGRARSDGRPVSKATLNRDRAALLALLNWARQTGRCTTEFIPSRFKEEPRRSGILSQEQIEAVGRHCRTDRWPFFWTLIETGARQGEVLNLLAGDIPLDADVLIVRSRPGSKNRGRERAVPISAELAVCLRTLSVVSGNGRLFPYGRTTVREWWEEIAAASAIKGVTIHGIRATFITLALDAGVPLVEVQKLVGHSDIMMTMKYYRKTEQSLAAAARARQALGGWFARQESAPVPALVTAPAFE